jgi:anaerobic dimethyl sulfoxide reductase subunit C (anchor subunit)
MNAREWALPVYTILMQLAVGGLLTIEGLRWVLGRHFGWKVMDEAVRTPLLVIVLTAATAMIAAHFHLSKPLLSYLAVVRFETSWLSREIVFSLLFLVASAALLGFTLFRGAWRRWVTAAGWLAALLGLVLVYSMAQIYVLPTQTVWNSNTVILSFYLTSVMLGVNAMVCVLLLDLRFVEIQGKKDTENRAQVVRSVLLVLTAVTVFLALLSIAVNIIQIYQLSQGDRIAQTSLRLLLEVYLPLLILRHVTLIVGTLILVSAALRVYRRRAAVQSLLVTVYVSCLLIIISEILGRFLFYATHIRVGL